MTFADQARLFTHLFATWATYLTRVGLLSLVAIGALSVALRLLLLRRLARGGGRALPSGSTRLFAVSLALGLGAGYWALRPDPIFLAARGEEALLARDYRGAVANLEPLVRWGSRRPDVHHNLGAALLFLGRPAEAARAFARADELGAPPTAVRKALLAEALWALGQRARALALLREALPLAEGPERQQAIRARLSQLEGAP